MSDWVKVCTINDVLKNGGSCVKVFDEQIAIFNFNRTEWYAVQNICPHKKQAVLSRGIIGESEGEPKVVCPLHKNNFSLKTGDHLGGNKEWSLKTYPIKVVSDEIYVQLEQI